MLCGLRFYLDNASWSFHVNWTKASMVTPSDMCEVFTILSYHWSIKNLEISALLPGPILDSKGMHAIFEEKGKKNVKKGKKVENIWKFGQNVQNLKIFEKGQVIACDYYMQ